MITSLVSCKLYRVWNYKLYLSTQKGGQTLTQLLVALPTFDDEMVNIIFAGDIDGDGMLDLLLDTADNYNTFSPTLYLSKPAEEAELLKVVGMHTSDGC